MDWSKDHQQRLHEYIIKYNDNLEDMTYFFLQIDWESLCRQFQTNNTEFLKSRVDEIFDSIYFKMDKDVMNVGETITLWNNKNKAILEDVADMLDALKLQSFVEQEEPKPTTMAVNATSRVELPKLTKTERRMSLDLLKQTPRRLSDSGTPQDISRTKPAAASTTTVNVITRAELNVAKEEAAKPKMEERFKDVQNRFKFVLGSKNSKKAPKVSIKIPSIQLDSTAEPIGKDQTSIKPKRSIQNGQQMERRVSMVGVNLPLYIRDQLQAETESPSPPVLKPKQRAVRATTPKRQTRLQNLLSNSQTLYAHSKDIPSIASNPSSHTNTPDTIEITRNNYSDEEDLLGELLRYYGVHLDDADDDDILNELEEDDTNFEAESFDVLNGKSNEDEDDYLFKI